MEQLDERVVLGAKLLDQKVPAWYERIDLPKLNLGSASRCVAAQATGLDYLDAVVELSGQSLSLEAIQFGRDHGFQATHNPFSVDVVAQTDAEYNALEASWIELILQRRSDALTKRQQQQLQTV